MNVTGIIPLLMALVLAPLLPGVIHRTKAVMAGRRGPPLLQLYWDLGKLLRKGAVLSRTTTWLFGAAPSASLAALVLAAALLPFGGCPALVSFPADFVLFAGLLAFGRFLTVLAALDTGSSFEGMGASREVQIAALVEPALLLSLAVLGWATSHFDLSSMLRAVSWNDWRAVGPALGLVGIALFLVLLAENSRIPVDDPNTHLELTMIHEVMALDHSGPDLAYILYGASVKLWLAGSLLVGLWLPGERLGGVAGLPLALGAMGLLGVLIGMVESVMARIRLAHVPQLLVGATALSIVALVLLLR